MIWGVSNDFYAILRYVSDSICTGCSSMGRTSCPLGDITLEKTNDIEVGTSPAPLNHKITDVREKALQRACLGLIGHGCLQDGIYTQLDDCEVQWTDMEVPTVNKGKSRRHCLDLLGIAKDKRMVLCELKYAIPGSPYTSNCPVYAALELERYRIEMSLNINLLKGHRLKYVNSGQYVVNTLAECNRDKKPLLLIAANWQYWENWKNRTRTVTLSEKIEFIKKTFMMDCYSIGKQGGDISFSLDGKKHIPGRQHDLNWKKL